MFITLFCSNCWERILLTNAPTNWNFEFVRTEKIAYSLQSLQIVGGNVNVNYQRLLTFVIFHNKRVCWVFNVHYYYFWTF